MINIRAWRILDGCLVARWLINELDYILEIAEQEVLESMHSKSALAPVGNCQIAIDKPTKNDQVTQDESKWNPCLTLHRWFILSAALLSYSLLNCPSLVEIKQ